MFDYIIENAHTCPTSKYFSTKVKSSDGKKFYTVEFDRLSPQRQQKEQCQYGWTCNCEGFKFRKTCSHVKKAEKKRCGWNIQLDPGNQPKKKGRKKVCPKCGRETEIIRVGV